MGIKIVKATGEDAHTRGLIEIGTIFKSATSGNRYEVLSKPHRSGSYYRVKIRRISTNNETSWLLNNADVIIVEVKSKSILKGGKNMLEKAKNEVTEFIGDNKAVLYWFAIIFVVDYYIFDGKFKGKLEHIFSSIVDKATSIIDKADKKEKVAE